MKSSGFPMPEQRKLGNGDFLQKLKKVVRIMLLLTNCEVHTGKYLDRSFEVRTERSEVRTKTKVQIFPVWTELIGQ